MRLVTSSKQDSSFDLESAIETAGVDQAIANWLEVVTRLSRIPEREQAELKEELATHLHDRVRDLALHGLDEQNALRRATDELGDAADLAQRISEAHHYPRRRLIMNCTIVGVGLAALGFGIVSVSGSNPLSSGQVFEAQDVRPIEDVLTTSADIDFKNQSISQVVDYFDSVTDRSIYVHWPELIDHGYGPDDSDMVVSLRLDNVSLGRAMALFLDRLPYGEELAWRVGEDLIELGIAAEFDRREAMLVAYEIGPTIEHLWMKHDVDDGADHISNLLTDMVEPDTWDVNGGNIARYNIVGGMMFVEAPPRMHERIAWLLEQLSGDGGVVERETIREEPADDALDR